MALNQIDSKSSIKYSTISGATPSIPLSIDHTDGTWNDTDIYIGEYFMNSVDDRLWLRTINGVMEMTNSSTYSTSPSTYLELTGGTMSGDIEMGTSTVFKSSNGGGQIDLDYGGAADEVLISTDNGAWNEGGIYLSKNNGVEIFNYDSYGININTTDSNVGISDTSGSFIINNEMGIAMNPSLTDTKQTISIHSNTSGITTAAPKKPVHLFLNSSNATSNIGLFNSVVIGGIGLEADTDSTVFVPDLNIQTSKSIKTSNGGGQIDLDYGGSVNSLHLSCDGGNWNDGQLHIQTNTGSTQSDIELSQYTGDDLLNIQTSNKKIRLVDGYTGVIPDGLSDGLHLTSDTDISLNTDSFTLNINTLAVITSDSGTVSNIGRGVSSIISVESCTINTGFQECGILYSNASTLTGTTPGSRNSIISSRDSHIVANSSIGLSICSIFGAANSNIESSGSNIQKNSLILGGDNNDMLATISESRGSSIVSSRTSSVDSSVESSIINSQNSDLISCVRTSVIGCESLTKTGVSNTVFISDATLIRAHSTPLNTASSVGNEGGLTWDDDYIYLKTSAGWKRKALNTF